jgi:uncharacterized membrane protein YdbT with pleckstrin-like domain
VPTIFDATTKAATPEKTKKTSKSILERISHEKGRMGPLTNFVVNPEGVRFETQEENERVILFLRQHIVVNVPWILTALIFLIAPTFLFPIFLNLVRVSIAVPAGYILVGTIFWYVATFGFVLGKFLGWFFNIYIVTNERVVDIDFRYLLYKNFSEAELTKIQDISYTSGGILSTIFNYGTVNVETAGEVPSLEFDMVPAPERVVETIRSLTERSENNP